MPDVSLDVAGVVAQIAIEAPERRNALTNKTAKEFLEALHEINSNLSIGAAVVRGSGGNFCAGAHREILQGAEMDPAHPRSFRETGSIYATFMQLGQCAVPTIAAVQGAVVGAGVNLMMAADLRIVGRGLRMISGFSQIGIHPGGGHFMVLNRTAGRETTAALTLFGEVIDGPEAYDLGLAWRCVEDDAVVDTAMGLAETAGADPELARATVSTFRMELAGHLTWDAALELERAQQMWSLRRRRIGGRQGSDGPQAGD